MARHAAEQGLARLMMKLPATRKTIRAAAASQPLLYELCGAYGEACSVLDRMREDRSADPAIIAEYEIICAEIEADVQRILLGDR
ncbi:nodulation protein [Pseudomonas sp. BGM005]|nr:nodulation protein [Pseudomonas sp. BG5]